MSDIEREEFSERDLFLMKEAHNAGQYYESLGDWLNEVIDDQGHVVAQHLAHDADQKHANTIPACDGQHDGGPCRDRECYVKPEAVAYRYRFTDAISGSPIWRFDRGPWNLQEPKETQPLYTTPPHPQAAAVPNEAFKVISQVIADLENGFVACSQCGDQEDTATLDCMDDLRRLHALLSAQPQTPGDGWVRCSERLPTEDDEDVCRQIWGWIDNKGIGGKWIRMSASEIRCMSENQTGPICKYWQHTGLRRPKPPQEG